MNTTVKSYTPKPADVSREWHVLDAKGQTLGRLATQIVVLLKGKHKPIYSPHFNTGDPVVVVNASQVKVSGGKESGKLYRWHSQHPGGLKERTFERLLIEHPDRIITRAVKGMLQPKPIRAELMGMLHVYPGPEHPHEAQVKASMAGHFVPSVPPRPAPRPKKEKAEATAQPSSTSAEPQKEAKS